MPAASAAKVSAAAPAETSAELERLCAVDQPPPADFETAASLTGFGKYNYLILLSAICCSLSHQFSTTAMSYLLPAAHCDLSLKPSDKGLLNAIGYGGMITSAFAWGFMSDILGRRKLLIIAYTLDGILSFIGSFTQSLLFLVLMKFIGGIIICGPISIQKTFISEFHCAKYRTRVLMASGLFVALSTIVIPGIAWGIIPLPWSWSFFGGYVTYNSWRVFVAVGSIPSFLSALIISGCAETPKFLMTKGRLDEALQVFRMIYKYNTGNDPKTFPVHQLKKETPYETESLTRSTSANGSPGSALGGGLKEAKRLFIKPLLPRALMIFVIQYSTLFGMNTMRLWAPQLFASIEEYNEYHKTDNGSLASASICDMITFTPPEDELHGVEEGTCGVAMINSTVYVNNMTIAAISGLFYIFAGFLVNLVGKKAIMLTGYAVAASCSLAIYWSYTSGAALAFISIYVSLVGVCHITSLAFVVDIFPTSLRNMAMSLNIMFGQLGTFSGNMAFPYLLSASCVAPFAVLGGIILVSAAVVLLLPNTDKAALQ
ncbi:synaptic vesicle glycoprotein 2C-like [Schistocerca americana]|uniref:synaptic vesicle glycoprotein 2C-like n=1 Tax=Schistocerca americana TaxID=7009 RepID=UPI001F50127D|nr:synaptic vesicle glycoprotein 2C-like [Schistocerca americana]